MQGDKVPFRRGRGDDILGVDTQGREDGVHLVGKGDEDVALAVLHDLAGLSDTYRLRLIGTIEQDAAVEVLQERRRGRCGPGDNFPNLLHRVLGVAGVDTLGRVADIEVVVEAQPRRLLQDRHTDLLRHPRPYRGLDDDDVTLTEDTAHHLTGLLQQRGVGMVVTGDGRRHSDDIHVALSRILEFVSDTKVSTLQGIMELRGLTLVTTDKAFL